MNPSANAEPGGALEKAPNPVSDPGPRGASDAATNERTVGEPTQESGPRPGHAWVIFESDTIRAEVAATPDQRARGLMERAEVPDGTGMLFVFEPDEIVERTFWMRDTPIDLDVAFMSEGYRIFKIARMEANSSTLHGSDAPVFAALEVPGGWFDRRGVAKGDTAVVVFGPR